MSSLYVLILSIALESINPSNANGSITHNVACTLPLIDLVYRRGKFLFTDTQTTAIYFFWFSLSLAL